MAEIRWALWRLSGPKPLPKEAHLELDVKECFQMGCDKYRQPVPVLSHHHSKTCFQVKHVFIVKHVFRYLGGPSLSLFQSALIWSCHWASLEEGLLCLSALHPLMGWLYR